MKRQSFLLLFILAIHGLQTLMAQPAKKDSGEFYQFTVYHYSDPEQENILDGYLQHALLPALHRMGMSNIGIFKRISNDTAVNKSLYVFMPIPGLQATIRIQEQLTNDQAYIKAGAAYINAVHTAAPYNRMETILMKAFSHAPIMKLPVLNADKKERVYELRSYESATEKIFKNKVHMFNEGGEIDLFAQLNFNAVFYSEVIAGSKMPNLMYMTCFENKADRDAHWKRFGDDPFWKKLSSMPEYQHNVSHIDIILLRPAAYSDF